MGQCVTISVGNQGAISPAESGGGGGTNISNSVGGGEEEEEEEEEGPCSCLEEGNCLPCL